MCSFSITPTWSQCPSNLYTTTNMSSEPLVSDMPTSFPDPGVTISPPSNINPPLSSPNIEDTHTRSQANQIQNHAKPNNPHLCTVPNCKHPSFPTKSSLDCHKREVHGSADLKPHYCPCTSCKHAQKGFARKYNLFEHQKRCHSFRSPRSALARTRDASTFDGDSVRANQYTGDEW